MIPLEVRVHNFVGAVQFAADEEMQRSVWIDKAAGVTSIISVGEFFCQFFDDNEMDRFITDEIADAQLSHAQKEAILNFCVSLKPVEQLQSYRDSDDLKTLASPEWSAVVQCAKRTLPLFAT